MTTRQLRIAVLCLLCVFTLTRAYYLVINYQNLPYMLRFDHLDIFSLANSCTLLVNVLVIVLAAMGVAQAVGRPDRPLPTVLHFPLIWIVVGSVISNFLYLFLRPSPELSESRDLQFWVFTFLEIAFWIVCFLYFAREQAEAAPTTLRWVNPWRRLLGWLLDIVAVELLLLRNVQMLAHRSNYLRDIEWMNDSPYPIIVLIMIPYYFTSEAIFSRSVGKVITGTYVVFEKRRVLSALWRTLSRFIPFEAFSCMSGGEGWHDTISSSTLRMYDRAEPVSVVNSDGPPAA